MRPRALTAIDKDISDGGTGAQRAQLNYLSGRFVIYAVEIDNGNSEDDEVSLIFVQKEPQFKVGSLAIGLNSGWSQKRTRLHWHGIIELEAPFTIIGEVVHIASIEHSLFALVRELI